MVVKSFSLRNRSTIGNLENVIGRSVSLGLAHAACEQSMHT